jgi:hypothetical protein
VEKICKGRRKRNTRDKKNSIAIANCSRLKVRR